MIFCVQLCPRVFGLYIYVGEEVYKGMIWTRTVFFVCTPFLRAVSLCNPEPQRANEVQGKMRKNLVRVEKKTEIPCCGSCQLKWKTPQTRESGFHDVIFDVITLTSVTKRVYNNLWSLMLNFRHLVCVFVQYVGYTVVCLQKWATFNKSICRCHQLEKKKIYKWYCAIVYIVYIFNKCEARTNRTGAGIYEDDKMTVAFCVEKLLFTACHRSCRWGHPC